MPRHRLIVAVFLLVGLLATACGPPPERPARPDVFLISIDTLRADHLGFHGYERDTSPFLDELAAEGVFVEQAVVATHGTTPSHASMLTSVPQEVHGVGLRGRDDDVVPSSLLTLPEVFRHAGYTTVAVTGGGNVGRSFGFDQGFDVFDDGARSVEGGANRLLGHLDLLPEDLPLFVFFHTYEVHTPYDPPSDLAGRFGETQSDFPTASRDLVALAHDAAALESRDLEHLRARYDEGIHHTDRTLRRLFGDLRDLGRLDDSLVAITSDHGEEFGEHGGLVHRDLLYEELIRVPMLFWGPRIRTPGRALPTALSLDLAPTIASCADLPVPEGWHGRDLLCSQDAPETEASEPTEVLVFQYGDRRYGVRTPRWKLILSVAGSDRLVELYDLRADPGEQENIADRHPQVVERLERELRRWRADLQTVESDAAPARLDEEERKRLEALGYLD